MKLTSNICHQAIFYNRSFFAGGLRYNIKYRVCADFDMNLRWFLNKDYHWKWVPIVVAHYNSTGFSSHTVDEDFWIDRGRLILKYNNGVLAFRDKWLSLKDYLSIRRFVRRIFKVVLK